MSTDTRTVSQIEHDLQRERAELASSLEALQERISIEGITRQITEQISRHGGDIGRSAMNSVKANPLPLALTGIGLAWMMMNDVQGKHASSTANGSAATKDTGLRSDGQSMGHRAAETADDLRDRMRQGTEELSEAARARVVEARERAYRARLEVERRTGNAGRQMVELFNDQPIVAGALALALGAALGTTIPRTKAEDQALGETSDRLFEDAERIFRDEVEKAKQATGGPEGSNPAAGDGQVPADRPVQDTEMGRY